MINKIIFKLSEKNNFFILLILLVISAVPVFLVQIPPLLDYPNHYVRMWLLGGGLADPIVSKYYAENWIGAFTNIFIDLIAVSFGKIFSVSLTAPAMLILAIILPSLGTALLSRKIFGTFHWWNFLTLILAWNLTLIAGFLNFEISLGTALIFASFEYYLKQNNFLVKNLTRVIFSCLLLLIHPFGTLFYAILAFGISIGPSTSVICSFQTFRKSLYKAIFAVSPIILTVIAFTILAPTLPGAHVKSGLATIIWQDISIKYYISTLVTPFKTYNNIFIDSFYLVIFFTPVIFSIIYKKLNFHFGLLCSTLILFIGSFLMPMEYLGTAALHVRLPTMLIFCFSAAVIPDLVTTRRSTYIAIILVCSVVCSRVFWISKIWIDRQVDFISLESTLSHIPFGSSILPLENNPTSEGMKSAPLGRYLGTHQAVFWHYPTLAILDRKSFVPLLFTAAGKQPIRVLSPWLEISVAEGVLESVEKLGDKNYVASHSYLNHWRERFDYILVINADIKNAKGPMPVYDYLELIQNNGFVKLYKIKK